MLAITDPNVRRVTVMGPTQLMKSSLLENTIGYYAHQEPAPILLAQPTTTLAEAFGKDRIDKMFRDSPALKGLIKDKKSRDAGNTLTYKAFPGGYLALVGSNSPTDLSSRPIRIALMDEVDKYPHSAGKEGDVVGLITERTATFFDSKVIVVCSPTIAGRSRVAYEYEQGDKRIFEVPCPHCGFTEEMQWENVKWPEGKPEAALYLCPECVTPWTEPERLRAISNGKWRATAEFKGHASFKCSKLVSPWEPVNRMAQKFVAAQGQAEQLKVFVNTQLAEVWEEKGEAPDFQRLYERRESYQLNTLPKGVVFLTAGVDVQSNRLEMEIVGWGRDKQSWSIDYCVLDGNPNEPAVWQKLETYLNKFWKTESGSQIQIRLMTVDSGAFTTSVYDWARRQSADRVRVVKGTDNLQTIVGTATDVDLSKDGSRMRRALRLWKVGVSIVKSELFGWLKLDKPEDGKPYPPGYCHFPEYDLEHFKRLASEHLMKRMVKGRAVYQWEKKYERNEQLDCRVYARAAASMFGIDKFTTQDWDVLEGKVQTEKVEQKSAERVFQKDERAPTRVENAPDDFWARQKEKKKLF